MIRVYEIPAAVPQVGFLHGRTAPITFEMVDWFGEDASEGVPYEVTQPELRIFLSPKIYRKPGRRYLVLADRNPDLCFVLEPAT